MCLGKRAFQIFTNRIISENPFSPNALYAKNTKKNKNHICYNSDSFFGGLFFPLEKYRTLTRN